MSRFDIDRPSRPGSRWPKKTAELLESSAATLRNG